MKTEIKPQRHEERRELKEKKILTTDDTEGTDKTKITEWRKVLKEVEIGLIAADPNQPRKEFAEEKLQEMRDSILRHGVLQPLIVRELDRNDGKNGRYVLVSGERRLRGAKMAGLNFVPVLIRELDEKQTFAVQMVENLQRENLTALEEAEALQKRVSAGARPDDLAKELGISRATVFGRLTLTRLQTSVRKALVEGKISTSVAQLIGMIPDGKQQEEMLEEAKGSEYQEPMSVRDVIGTIEDEYCKGLKGAPFDLKDALLVPIEWDVKARPHPGPLPQERGEPAALRLMGGACTDCPYRTGNMPEFPENKTRPNVCTRPECYQQKCAAHWVKEAAGAVEKGQTVLEAKEYKRSKGKYVEGTYSDHTTGYNSWEDCMGKHAPRPVLAVTERGLIKVYPREEAKEAALKNGKNVGRGGFGITKEEREKHGAKMKEEAARKVAREKLLMETAPVMVGALEKLSDKESWELMVSKRNQWHWSLLSKAMVKAAKSDRGRMLADEMGKLMDPTRYDGQWSDAVKDWKSLGVDLIKLEKDGKWQMANGKAEMKTETKKEINAETQRRKGAKGPFGKKKKSKSTVKGGGK